MTAEATLYGLDRHDPRYQFDPEKLGDPADLCHCLRHPAWQPTLVCDLESARAAEMDDPRFCFVCCRAFDRLSCQPTKGDTGRRDVCGECQEKENAPVAGQPVTREVFSMVVDTPAGAVEYPGFESWGFGYDD